MVFLVPYKEAPIWFCDLKNGPWQLLDVHKPLTDALYVAEPAPEGFLLGRSFGPGPGPMSEAAQ